MKFWKCALLYVLAAGACAEGTLRLTPVEGAALDGHPLSRVALGALDLGLAVEARRSRDGILLLRPDGTLRLLRDNGGESTLDRAVQPGVAVDGARIAYVVAQAEEEVLRESGRPPIALRHVDRLAFVDGRLWFVGSEPGGLPGLYLREGATARRLTNRGMRSGGGLPADFVPPPVDAALRAAPGGVVYCDGEQGWFVALDGRAERRGGCAP